MIEETSGLRSLHELFALKRDSVDVPQLVGKDDFSCRGLFSAKSKERDRENVVQDDKEVDITALVDGLG